MHPNSQDTVVLDFPTADAGLLQWRTAIAETVVPLDIQEWPGRSFHGRYRRAVVDQAGIFEMETSPHIVRRLPHLIGADQPRFYKLSLQLSGTAILEQDGREARLSPGDLAVYDTQRPYTLRFPEDTRTMVMVLPPELVELTPHEIARVTAVRFGRDQGFARMISPFLCELSQNLDQLSGSYASRLVHSALDLMVTLLSEELHLQDERSHGRGRQLAREIRGYIAENLGDPELSPSSIAGAHFISLRYLYTLFQEEGHTVSAWIRTQRLSHIRRDLADPLYADRTVSWIASRWGLHDAAHFSRLFKAEHGEAPTAYRRRHLTSPRSAPALSHAA